MKARVKWVEQVTFVGESDSGHAVVMDGSPESGGRNLGPRPMEMLLLGAGGCTSFDVISILKKSRQAVSDCYVELEAERAEADPKAFTKNRIPFGMKGKANKTGCAERAIRRTAEKYCSASIMLRKTAAITHDFEIVKE